MLTGLSPLYGNAGVLSDGNINIGGLSLDGTDSVTYDGSTFIVGDGGAFTGDISLGAISVGVALTGITESNTLDGVPTLNLTSILASVSTTAGHITIGSVDYSGLVLKWACQLNPDSR